MSLSSTDVSFVAIVLFVVVEVVLTIFLFIQFISTIIFENPSSQYLTSVSSNERCAVGNGRCISLRLPVPMVGTVAATRAPTWHFQN